MSARELFARYAYPPNELGYCGPVDPGEVLGSAPFEDTVRCFEGTWPYFEFIAAQHGLGPLDERVIESYWLGGGLTTSVDVAADGRQLLEALALAGGSWAHSPEALLPGMTPDHNFHVFAVYPWLGLLQRNVSDQPRLVLDRCRIRWGTILSAEGDEARVRSQPLVWDGDTLALGEPVAEQAQVAKGDVQLTRPVGPGTDVVLHWNWICDRVDAEQLEGLKSSTNEHLRIANERLVRGLA